LQVAALQADYEAKIKSLKGLQESGRPSSRQQKQEGQVMPSTLSEVFYNNQLASMPVTS